MVFGIGSWKPNFSFHIHISEVKSNLFKHTHLNVWMQKKHKKVEGFLSALHHLKVIHCHLLVLEQKRHCLCWVLHSIYSISEEQKEKKTMTQITYHAAYWLGIYVGVPELGYPMSETMLTLTLNQGRKPFLTMYPKILGFSIHTANGTRVPTMEPGAG